MSKTTSPKALLALLSGHPTLSGLTREAKKVARKEPDNLAPADPLDCLPPALRERVMLVEDNMRWLAIAETSATAQLLRFHLPKLQQALPGQQIKIMVGGKRQMQNSNVHANQQDKPRLTRESARQIADLADSIEDEGLKASLQRLASRGESE
ncbi:MAG: hypothetical protein P1U59_14120 [Alcanivorax sp.]|jgi:hypothetical protein|uniref:hypothetical protein n=1 Tax=Alcanivorax sp. TaxID=1872427 RepID=UPI0019C03BBF|nr:hypothetical protein [Alcanivorax sp.]MBD3643021.1 hypothetical protein [Alcanivorax sp.]MDF1725653.1 hypothetical protein [Alcanivorax sp.]